MVENGLYKIKDQYYVDFPHDMHIQNKGGRPFYYAVKDNYGIYWLIPISSQVDVYKQKISVVEAQRGVGNCITYHIGIIANQERAFRICNMLPISDEYVDGEFEINGSHYVVGDLKLIKEVSVKSRNYIKQVELGRMYSQIDALSIRKKLIANQGGKV